jgi:uncharacterized membrane protein YedE/YeeE
MSHFTPVSALVGGGLIGLSAALLWLGLGRIAGISGILAGTWSPDRAWRLTFLAGLVAAPAVLQMIIGTVPRPAIATSWPAIVLGGLLVGFGTRIGGGCTSGHGVCGVARLSARSVVATAVFMAVAVATAVCTRHVGAV